MKTIKNIIIGTSLGEESDQVVRSGLAVARAVGAQVFLVHASPLEPQLVGYEAGAATVLRLDQISRSEEELRRQIERLGAGPELAGTKIEVGAPHRLLVETADEVGADLIVVGATGSGPLATELLGSTADRVARKAPCPVLIVRGELQVPPRQVLAPVDLSTLSGDSFRCGLQILAQLAGTARVHVRAIHALSLLDALDFRQRTGMSVEQAGQHASSQLLRFIHENGAGLPLTVEATVVPGEPRFEILRELQEHPANL
ncbi:MAG TPA: universal stress protein, partial [Thermoanaerobaculia bacterium]|nr:universal stress protein [Thermoanaerobaculia bacterium]